MKSKNKIWIRGSLIALFIFFIIIISLAIAATETKGEYSLMEYKNINNAEKKYEVNDGYGETYSTIYDYKRTDAKQPYEYYCINGGLNFGGTRWPIKYNTLINLYNLTGTQITSRFPDQTSYNKFKWLMENMYVDGLDDESTSFMVSNINKIIKSVNGTDVDINSVSDKSLLQVMNQVLIWEVIGNKNKTVEYSYMYQNIVNNLQNAVTVNETNISANDAKILKEYITAFHNASTNIGVIANSNSSNYFTSINNWKIENSKKYIQGGFSGTEGNNVYVFGPYKISNTVKSEYVQQYETGQRFTNDEIKIDEVYYYNKNKESRKLTDFVPGEEYYIKVKTSEPITTTTTFSHSVRVVYKPIVSSITANGYALGSWENSSKQQILEMRKTLSQSSQTKSTTTTIQIDKTPDLALTKQIVSVDGQSYTDDDYAITIGMVSGENNDGDYTDCGFSSKKSVAEVKPGSKVVYDIVVYNEGDEIDGYVKEVRDYLPQGLKYESHTITLNDGTDVTNNWNFSQTNENSVLIFGSESYGKDDSIILKLCDGATLDKFTIRVTCTVEQNADPNQELINYAGITSYGTYNGDEFRRGDIDSSPNYLGTDYLTERENQKGLIPTSKVDKNEYDIEDDDDFARIKVVVPTIDVGLKKSIIGFESDGRSTEEDSRLYSIITGGPQNEKYVVSYPMYKTVYSQDFAAGDKIKYAIDIYNEGEIDASAYEIIDYLPDGLELTKIEGFEKKETKTSFDNSVLNSYYYDVNNNCVYIKLGNTNLIPAFTGENANSTKLEENRVRIITECIIKADAPTEVELINVAEITKYITKPEVYVQTKNGTESSDANGLIDTDIDSGSATLKDDTNLESYLENIAVPQENSKSGPKFRTAQKATDTNKIDEDDQDYEVIILKPSFDLALRKFITKIGNTEITDRESDKYWTTGYAAQLVQGTTISYNNHKNPLVAQIGDTVTYTIRVYNEGYIDGYASKIVDYLPQGLEFKENSSINAQYGWVATKNENGTTTVVTEYLAPDENNESINRIGATGAKGIAKMVSYIAAIMGDISLEEKYQQYLSDNGKSPYYRDVQIECIITEDMYNVEKDGLENYLINVAEISKYGYYNDNNQFIEANVENVDIDSEQDTIFTNSENVSTKNIHNHINDVISEAFGQIWAKDFFEGSDCADSPVPGLQDDDDFEIVYVPEPLDLNLQLVKVDSEDSENKINGVKFKVDEVEYTTGTKDGNKGIIQIGSEIKKAGTYVYKISETSIENTGILEKLKYDLMLSVQVELDETTRSFKVTKVTLNEVVNGEPIGNTLDIVTNLINNTAQVQLQLTDGKFVLAKAKYNKQTGTIELVIPNRIKQFDLTLQKFITEIGREEVSEDNKNVTEQSTNNTSQEIQSNESQTSETEQTKINYTKITNREPKFSIDEQGNYVYKPTEEELGALEVINGDIVVYTIRIYNEGDLDGYAERIMDDIPENLEFLPQNEINAQYKWKMLRQVREDETVTSKDENAGTVVIGEQTLSYTMYNGKMYVVTENVEEAEYVVTNYLSKQNGTDNLIKYFDAENYNAETMEGPDYKDVKIAFKVKEPGANRVIINYAQISEDLPIDRQGNETDVEDKDSTPNVWEESPRDDDQDIEMIRVKEFDLSLKKCVTTAILIDNGKQTVYEGNSNPEEEKEIIKVDIPKSKIDDVIVKFKYKIRVYNEGEIEGFVREITDYVPEGLRFVASEDINIEYGWTDAGEGKITTDYLKNKLLQPGEYADVEIMFTWINAENNMSLKTNIAEISEDYNEFGDVPDIDSTPDNFVPGEDDIDTADVLLTPKTGNSIETMYIALAIAVVGLISTGTILIKKFVL